MIHITNNNVILDADVVDIRQIIGTRARLLTLSDAMRGSLRMIAQVVNNSYLYQILYIFYNAL